MNLFSNYFISVILYIFLFYSTVVSDRISDKRKCADAECSRPVSIATTMLNYFADDDRLVSFPRNIKVRVFSKEAGNNPTFWEIEEEGSNKCMNLQGSRKHFLELCHEVVYGKRGYAPKGLLREEKVLIPSSKLTHIVSTRKTDPMKQNATDTAMKKQVSDSSNLLSATPELTAANSKGFFSTIGGVSADSVPMNSPDIKPQSTRKFQVFAGTTFYDDVVSEKPESPPTIIDNNASENRKSEENPQQAVEEAGDSNVPSSEVKPVTEEIDEKNQSLNEKPMERVVDTPTGTLIKEEDNLKEEQKDMGTQPKEGESSFLGSVIDTLGSYISSGAGESVTEEGVEEEEEEEEDDEGSAEEEDSEDEEKKDTKDSLDETKMDKLEEALQHEGETMDTLPKTSSDTPTFKDIVDNGSIHLKPDDVQDSHKNTPKDETLLEKPAKESTESTSEMKLDTLKVDAKVDDIEPPSTISDASSNILSDGPEVGKSGPLVNESDSAIEGDQQHTENTTSPDVYTEQSVQQNTVNDMENTNEKEIGTEDSMSHVKESLNEKTEGQSNETLELNVESNANVLPNEGIVEDLPSEQPTVEQVEVVDKVEVEVQSENGEKLDQEQPNINEVLVQGEESSAAVQIEKEIKNDEVLSAIQDQTKTDSPQDGGQSKKEKVLFEKQPVDETPLTKASETDEPRDKPPTTESLDGQDQPKPDVSQLQEDKNSGEQIQQSSETATEVPAQQPARQFMYGSRQPSQIPLSPEPVEIKLPDESLNNTNEENLPQNPEYPTSLPPMQPLGSPKYSAVVTRRIQSSDSYTVHQVKYDSGEDDSATTGGTSNNEETLPPHLLQSQSPTYSNVVTNRIGSVTPQDNLEDENTPSSISEAQVEPDAVKTEDNTYPPSPLVETIQSEVVPEDAEPSKTVPMESNEVPIEDSPKTSSDEVVENTIDESPANIMDETATNIVDETIEETTEGMFSWVTSYLDVFGSKDDAQELPPASENLDPSRVTRFAEETCSADGVEGSCPFGETMQKEVTWQETTYSTDMWELLDKVPLEATIWLIVTAVVVLIFSLGHYYIEAHRRDGPLVAVINKLEREVLILKKENCIMDDRLTIAQQQLETWNTSSTENDALLVELKQELEETKAAKAELEEQAAQLKEELETVTESGLEMHRLLEESLSSQDGSQVLLSTVETLREKLQRQEEEISGLSDTLSSKNAEVEELHGRLAQSAEVARGLEDKVISVVREKDEELLKLRDKHRELISQLEEVMETKALDETRLSTEMSKLRLAMEELQKTLAEKDSELDTLKEVVKQLRATDSNEKIEALFDVVAVQAKLRTAVAERDDLREKFMEEEGARKLLEGHMKKITQEVVELKNSFETAEKEKIEALTKLQVLSNYFKEKESQLQKELGLQESMWLQKQSDDHSIYEQMRSLREENEKYKIVKAEPQTNSGTAKPLPNLAEVKTKKKSNPKLGSMRQTTGLQNESLKKEIVEQESSFKIQLANTEQKAHENWVASRQAERKLKETQQEAAQLRNRLTTVEKNTANYSLDEKQNISESNGDPSSPPPSLMFPPTTSPPFMMYGPPIPHGDFVPPPPLMGSPYPSDSRPPPLGRISSPPLDHRFSPPPPLPYSPYEYSPYGHHSPSPPPPLPPHHRNVHKPQPREMSREQKEHVPTYSPEAEKTSRRNKR
ncbi:transport and Golgi organization protein 1 isoform X2 [Macrosteles quadrilineatus]|uniref:transport and Golgi organization protein 1 isoform X2 n=1 Tax=Macrosteles quadrilineatus TaxID=74068 RepID=UPI0023E225D2|nr:transport and Golgi organization protein 1 isoform X2 [Macrosteles quadrilineatus]